jgi:hypothetical protein
MDPVVSRKTTYASTHKPVSVHTTCCAHSSMSREEPRVDEEGSNYTSPDHQPTVYSNLCMHVVGDHIIRAERAVGLMTG